MDVALAGTALQRVGGQRGRHGHIIFCLVNILPLVIDVVDERFIGTFTGLSGVPAQLAAVVGPSVAGLIVEVIGRQRVLFLVAVVALAQAWLLLARLKVPLVFAVAIALVEPGPQRWTAPRADT